jgi:putative hydrolase of the HAD superfamily
MQKKAIILDLDNTIYPVTSIGNKLFASLLKLIQESKDHDRFFDEIKKDIMRRPFQVVAAAFNFSTALTQEGIDLLKELTYDEAMLPFEDYVYTKNLLCKKYLVTTGFQKLQQSKIAALGIENDFEEINIVDPLTSTRTKKDVFADIIFRNNYDISEVLVVGDDMHSEIKAAQELGIDTVLYDKFNLYPDRGSQQSITNFSELKHLLTIKLPRG